MKFTSAFQLVSAINDVRSLDETTPELMRFMLSSCGLIVDRMPSVAVDALTIARRYWNGEASLIEVEQARIRCWQHLEETGSTTNTDDSDVCAIRAVLCLLYPSGKQEDQLDLAHLFIRLTQKIAAIDAQQQALLMVELGTVLQRDQEADQG